ncbi:thiamine pyrophosphate-dependent enzyme [Herbivorax sp. ANBcel31]|uniref:thiamine pyrophosphate-dependent enzyme n=1 Tax=Herbivorax sp. ANBcel31 TaxID=3069754 RepID=UPI0027B3D1D3|nr:thiamine pyrophosphate-dependent enzyme [Herbivorax sp. ANBcel31]MDQ2086802.1 thiamine pyrophosphate-dependent enzyme [Herbivorax sp. ANBcel31]
MAIVFKKPSSLSDTPMHYCPGCTHGIIHRIIAQVVDELDIEGKIVGMAPVGCSYNNYEYFRWDTIQAAHGRAPAVATGVKRSNPDNIVFTYQGDGDLAAIGTSEIVHAATRGEKITTIFVNNAIYGMTSGQMAPTTLINQVTATSPFGRKSETEGFPIKVSELLGTLEGAAFIERTSVNNIKNIKNTKKAIEKAFRVQMANKGFSMVEILSSCPTNWGMSPLKALKWVEEKMIEAYPLGNFKGKDMEV